MDLDLDMSIPDRNVELETKLLNQYYNEFVDNYISKIVKLDSHPDFIWDDSFNGIKSSEHIIYKLRTNETGATHLLSRDGNRGYEFVIEFDKREPAYGIYYGCKGLIFGGDQEREINTFLEEWKSIRKEVSYILNNTFPDKNFLNRYKSTNNANNKTYWPFWISLYEEEDVIKVAARVVRIIYNVYKLRIVDGVKCNDKININTPGSSTLSQTAYTDERYATILETLNSKDRILYTAFLDNATELGLFEKDTRYEKCWRVKGLKNIEVYYLVQEFVKRLSGDKVARNNKWNLFKPILLSKWGVPIDFKRTNSTTKEFNKEGKSRVDEANERINEILFRGKK